MMALAAVADAMFVVMPQRKGVQCTAGMPAQ